MKLNIKLFFVAALGFAAGFVACLVLGITMSGEQTSSRIVPTSSAVAFTQAQPERIVIPGIGVPPPHERRVRETVDFVPEIELRNSRSLDLIDTRDRYQPSLDLEETHK